jgi:DNA adenine methylase
VSTWARGDGNEPWPSGFPAAQARWGEEDHFPPGHRGGAVVDSPLRWPGGKRRLRGTIRSLLPQHSTYIEPFAGACWVLLSKVPSPVEVLGDKEAELVTFFRVIRDQPEDFLRSFAWELCSRAEFTRLSALDPTALSAVERAHRFYYLVMAGWGAELRYPRFQTSVRDGGHGNRLIGALEHLEQRIWPAHRRLQGVVIEEGDWEQCFERYDSPGSVAYLDPPYPGNRVNYTQNMREWGLHVAIAERLATARGSWILSSYDHQAVRDLFARYTILPVRFYSGLAATRGGATRVLNQEVLITNQALPGLCRQPGGGWTLK